MTEKILSQAFQSYFSKWFNIETEIMPVGSRRRIDLVMTSKINKDYIFGVELKSDNHKQGNNLGSWLKQAEDYSKHKFNIRGYNRIIPVLIYPAISAMFIQIIQSSKFEKTITYEDPKGNGTLTLNKEHYAAYHNLNFAHSNINGIVSAFNIGEIRKVWYGKEEELGYGFIYKNQFLWHEQINHHKVNYKKYFKWHK